MNNEQFEKINIVLNRIAIAISIAGLAIVIAIELHH